MDSKKIQLLITLQKIQSKGDKTYCMPHTRVLRRLLQKYNDNDRSERTIYRYLQELEFEGYIWRQERWQTNSDMELRRMTSIIHLTLKAVYYLIKIGIVAAKRLLSLLCPHKSDSRPIPAVLPADTSAGKRNYEEGRIWLDKINKIIGFREEPVVV